MFVDGNNLYHRLKDKGWRTDISIGELAKRLTGGERILVRTYYYNAPPPRDAEHAEAGHRYLAAILKGVPNIVFRQSRLQPTEKVDENGRYKTYVEKGADAALVADLVLCAARDEFDIAILVSNDGDFASPVGTVQDDYGKAVEVVYFQDNVSFALLQIAKVVRVARQSYFQEMDRPRRSRRSKRPESESP